MLQNCMSEWSAPQERFPLCVTSPTQSPHQCIYAYMRNGEHGGDVHIDQHTLNEHINKQPNKMGMWAELWM